MNILLVEHITQCAWCLSIMADGKKIEDCHEILDISHGICNDCMEKIYQKEAA